MRSLLVASLALVGCATFPNAQLIIDSPVHDVVQAPVVCGPMGFRKSPLQSRWGEYVRVTVTAPGALRGTAFVNANGVVGETRAWNTEDGALVVEARFENLDPDARFALRREQPIDVTLSGLAGTCEGAVFTVEQGELVPEIDERAWLDELVRRGGPELAARREAARVEAEARRQAHYAAWDARRAEGPVLVANAAIREAHYAAWELARSQSPEERAAEAGVGLGARCSEGLASSGSTANVTVVAAMSVSASRGASCPAPSGVMAASGAVPSGGGALGGVAMNGCASCAVASGNVVMSGSSGSAGCASCAAPSETVAMGAPSGSVAMNGSVALSGCASCTVPSGSVAMGAPSGSVAMNGSVAMSGCASCVAPSGSVAMGAPSGSVPMSGCASCASNGSVTVDGWSAYQPSGGSGGDSIAAGGVAGSTDTTGWTAYPTAQLQPVPTSVEWTAYPPVPPAPVVTVAPAPVVTDEEVAVSVVLPALFNAVFQVAAAAPPPPAPRVQPRPAQHGAVPLNTK